MPAGLQTDKDILEHIVYNFDDTDMMEVRMRGVQG